MGFNFRRELQELVHSAIENSNPSLHICFIPIDATCIRPGHEKTKLFESASPSPCALRLRAPRSCKSHAPDPSGYLERLLAP
jgi:hypothetical protein